MIGTALVGAPLLGAALAGLLPPARGRWVLLLAAVVEAAAVLLGTLVPATGIPADPATAGALGTAALAALLVGARALEEEGGADRAAIALVGLGGVALVGELARGVDAALALSVTALVLVWAQVRRSAPGAAAATGQQYVVWMTLAGTALVLAAALDRRYAEQPGPGLLGPAVAFFIIGVGIVLAAAPFSLWLPSLCEEAPAGAALSVGLLGAAAVVLLTGSPGFTDLLASESNTRAVLAVGGALAGLAAAFLALGERRPGRAAALLLGAGSDIALASLASSPPGARGAVLALLLIQSLAGALALAVLDAAGAGPGLQGLLWRRPALGLALAVGLLGLAGMPLTASFPFRLAVARASLAYGPGLTLALAGTSLLGGLAALRILAEAAGRTDAPRETFRLLDGLAVLTGVLLIAAGLIPWPLVPVGT
ncbi:MAG: hypothetical protein IRY83_12980 [Chloroflexi bacterium]|nr:hypothetical protein [Chloroflexota bacterium]